MIVVVGTSVWGLGEPAAPAGRASGIALAAARAGSRVELVGRIGDDPAGDSVLIELARAGVGHVAMLRDAARPTPVLPPWADAETVVVEGAEAGSAVSSPPPGLALEPEDVALALRYLPGFEVLIVTDDVPADVLPVAVEAAAYAGAHLVLLLAGGREAPASMPATATVLAVPDEEDEGAFDALVGSYAAALERGASAGEAFAAAAAGTGWEPAARG